MLQKIAQSLTNSITSELGYDDKKSAIIEYGLLAMLHTTTFIVLVWVLGLILGCAVGSLGVCLSAAVFRRISGGHHAATSALCTSSGVVICSLLGLMCRYIPPIGMWMYCIGAGAMILAFIVTFRLAPVDCENKRIKKEEKRKRLKRTSLLILVFYTLLCACLIVCYTLDVTPRWSLTLYYAILTGTLWQTFMLTSYGARFLKILEKIFLYKAS